MKKRKRDKGFEGNFGCPYRNLTVAIGSKEQSGYFCEIRKMERCLTQDHEIDCYECSYFLFPEFIEISR